MATVVRQGAFWQLRLGTARLGTVWHGSQGKFRQCKVCHGTVGPGRAVEVWHGSAQFGKLRSGMAVWVRRCEARLGAVWRCTAAMARHGLVRSGW